MFEIIIEYTTGSTFGRNKEIQIVHTCHNLGEANLIASLFAEYAQLNLGTVSEEDTKRAETICTTLESLGVKLDYWNKNNFRISTSGFGWFDSIERIYVRRNTPECFEWIA